MRSCNGSAPTVMRDRADLQMGRSQDCGHRSRSCRPGIFDVRLAEGRM
jgi:hypothetical protein